MRGDCPRCGDSLTERTFGATKIDGCAGCGGLWFDCQELNSVTRDPLCSLMEVERAFDRALLSDAAGGAMHCPRCDAPLKEFSFPHTPNVLLDACTRCKGIWMDDGEMEKIAERVAGAGPGPRPTTAPAPPDDRQRFQARAATAFLVSAPCSSCRTSNPAGTLSCWACGAAITTRSVVRLCPRCDRPLEERRAGAGVATHVDICIACTGVWLEGGEIAAFYQAGIEAISEVQSGILAGRGAGSPGRSFVAAQPRCPGCQCQMEARIYGDRRQVHVDACGRCRSLWLDGGELLTVYELMQSGGFTMTESRDKDPWSDAV